MLASFCTAARLVVSAVSLFVGVAFLAYGIFVMENPSSASTTGRGPASETSGASERALAVVSVCVGALMALQAVCVIAISCVTDRRLEAVLNGLREENDELTASIATLSAVGERYRVQAVELERTSSELTARVTDLSAHNREYVSQNSDFAAQNSMLRTSLEEFRAQNDEYKRGVAEAQALNAELKTEIAELSRLKSVSAAEIAQLQQLCDEQRRRIEQLTVQAQNLNTLQRESVRMIQQLALYGEESKALGVSLADVSRDLRETDESLEVTQHEMAQQVNALRFITAALVPRPADALSRPSAAAALVPRPTDALSRPLAIESGAHITPDLPLEGMRHILTLPSGSDAGACAHAAAPPLPPSP